MIEPSLAIQERGRILERMCDYFTRKASTIALFVRGSIAEGTADAWSDIDFAAVVEDASFEQFCAERHSAPEHWGDLLFNSGSMGPNMCVSHFVPFIKVDVFYYRAADLSPSPWHARAIHILHDRHGVVRELCRWSRGMSFRAEPATVNRNINQALASTHEVLRRLERGELAYAQSILDSLRHNLALADDFLHDRPAMGLSHVETRCTDLRLLAALNAAHPRGHDPGAILAAVRSLVPILREQIVVMTAKFSLDRRDQRDEAALAIVTEWQLHPGATAAAPLHKPEKHASELTDGEIVLRLTRDVPADPEKQWLRTLHYAICVAQSGEPVGRIDLRLGYTTSVVRYGGNLGYTVEPRWRGHHYAGKACTILKPVAKAHGMDVLWITCNPDNWPSRKTCEWIGASLVEILNLPPENDQYQRGEREKCRYRWIIY